MASNLMEYFWLAVAILVPVVTVIAVVIMAKKPVAISDTIGDAHSYELASVAMQDGNPND